MNRLVDYQRGRQRKRRRGLRIMIVAAVAVLIGCLVPAPASAAEQSAKNAVFWTAQFCPENPTDPTGVGTVHGDCWSPTVNHANFVQQTLTTTATAPVFWASSGANDVLFNGAQPDTDVDNWGWAMAGRATEQVDTLLSLVYFQQTTQVNGDRVHATATVRAAGVTKEHTVGVGLFCDQEGCVERELNQGLTGCLGCVNPLAYSTSFYGDGSSSMSDSLENFEPRKPVALLNDPLYRSGGPGKVDGRAVWWFHVQTKKASETWRVHATSTLYSVKPVDGSGCKIKSMKAIAGGEERTELVRWNPSEERNYGTTLTDTLGVDLGFKFRGVPINFLVGRSWTRHEGVTGGTSDSQGDHVMLWKHANKKGTSQARSVSGVEIYTTPSGSNGWIVIGGGVSTKC